MHRTILRAADFTAESYFNVRLNPIKELVPYFYVGLCKHWSNFPKQEGARNKKKVTRLLFQALAQREVKILHRIVISGFE